MHVYIHIHTLYHKRCGGWGAGGPGGGAADTANLPILKQKRATVLGFDPQIEILRVDILRTDRGERGAAAPATLANAPSRVQSARGGTQGPTPRYLLPRPLPT